MHTIALACLALGAPPAAVVVSVQAPELHGGSEIRVFENGMLSVLDPASGEARWTAQLGSVPSAVVADDARVYAATRRHLRAFAHGRAGWSLDMGGPVRGLRRVRGRYLGVRLGQGQVFVDPARGAFCTPRVPCPGLPAWTVGQVGVPFLDLPGFGVPGLGLVINPSLLEEGDGFYGIVSPGVVPGFVPPPGSDPSQRVRGAVAGPTIRLERGRSGKVRSISAGGLAPSPSLNPTPPTESEE